MFAVTFLFLLYLNQKQGFVSLNAQAKDGVGISAWGDNRIDVFIRTVDNHVRTRSKRREMWSPDWTDLGGDLSNYPRSVSWSSGRIDVFGPGPSSTLQHAWFSNNTWSKWQDLNGTITGAVSPVSDAIGSIELYMRSSNNSLVRRVLEGGVWKDWENLGGNLYSSPSAAIFKNNGQREVHVAALDASNGLILKSWNGTAWSGWKSLSGDCASDPLLVYLSGEPQELHAYVRGKDNGLWRRKLPQGSSYWSNWERIPDKEILGSFGATVRAGQRVVEFVTLDFKGTPQYFNITK